MSDHPTEAPRHVALAEAVAALAGRPAGGTPYAELISRGTLRVGLYAPRGKDPQQPHDQDEVYVVMSGRGTFRNGPASHPFQPGDVLFVSAGVSSSSSRTSATISTSGWCSTDRPAARRPAETARGSDACGEPQWLTRR